MIFPIMISQAGHTYNIMHFYKVNMEYEILAFKVRVFYK